MKKIYKYELPINGGIIKIPNAVEQFLEVQEQNGIPMIWAIVDLDVEDVEPIEIIALGTGWEVPSTVDKYLGTAQDEFGFVWHYFTIKLQELEYQIDYEKTFAALAEVLGKVGVSAEQATQAFNMSGLFDACM